MDIRGQILLFAAGFLIVFSLISPLLFTLPAWCRVLDFSEKGQIGDTIGGIMNPFIGIAGVILTFLAFYIQKEANDALLAETTRRETKLTSDIFHMMISDLRYASRDLDKRILTYSELISSIADGHYCHYSYKEPSVSMYVRMAKGEREILLSMLSSLKNFEDPGTFLTNYYGQIDAIIEKVAGHNAYFQVMTDNVSTELNKILDIVNKMNNCIQSNGYDIELIYGDTCFKSFTSAYRSLDIKSDLAYDQVKSLTEELHNSMPVTVAKLLQETKIEDGSRERLKANLSNINNSCSDILTSYRLIDGIKESIKETSRCCMESHREAKDANDLLLSAMEKAVPPVAR